MTELSRRAGGLLIAAVLILGAFFIGIAASGWSLFSGIGAGEPFTEVGPTVVDRVRDLAELTTVEMTESTTIEKGNDFGWLNWARGDRVFMFAVAEIGAGVDLRQLYGDSFEVDTETGHVRVTLPAADITYVALDNEQTQVIDRDTGLFTKGDAQLESDARQVAEQVLRHSAVEHGILERAEANAKVVIEGFLIELGYESVDFVSSPAP
jgi:Protein of unknown function (DUF4230)